jgi:RNA polymerase sigma factor (sigma-70 family)
VNLLRSRQRREVVYREVRGRALVDQGAGWVGPDAQVLEGELLSAVARALLRVKPQHRRALVLRIVHGLNNTEIAESEGVPLATVGTWLRRGREELTRALGPVALELGRRKP